MKTGTMTALAVIATLVPALSMAQQAPGMRPQPPQIVFTDADADGSGGISREEWSAYVTAQMEARRDEMMARRADELIEAGDADADGALTRDELIAGMTALHEQRRAERAEHRGEDGGEHRHGWMGRHGDHERGEHGHGARDHGRPGHDGPGMRGGMDPAERALRAFDRIDDNGDGQIEAEELADMQARMQRHMERRMERRGDN